MIDHPRQTCRCGQVFILVGNATPGVTWRYCPHCDRPHAGWTANLQCVACQLYARATSST